MKRSACSVLAIALGIVVMLASCSDSDPEVKPFDPEIYFTFNVAQDFDPDGLDHWIAIHDKDGKLIEAKTFDAGDEIAFETSKKFSAHEDFTVTIFRFNPQFKYGHADSYMGIPFGDAWSYPTIQNPFPETTDTGGRFSVSVKSEIALNDAFISDANGNLVQSTKDGMTFSITGKIIEESSSYLVGALDEQGVTRYTLLEDVSDGDVFTLSFEEMNEFDHVVNIDVPDGASLTAIVKLFDGGHTSIFQGYHSNIVLFDYMLNSIGLSYLDGAKSVTYVSISQGNKSYAYRQYGNNPNEIELPYSATVDVSNYSLDGFRSSSSSFINRESQWRYQDFTENGEVNISWTVIAPSGVQQVSLELPDEFETQYPYYVPEKLKHQFTEFNLDGNFYGDSYESLIQGKFKTPTGLKEYEFHSVAFYTP